MVYVLLNALIQRLPILLLARDNVRQDVLMVCGLNHNPVDVCPPASQATLAETLLIHATLLAF